ncbi:MAG: hypothetical protein ACREGI_01525, partial [Candidatus Levyibacteriota bacterium]
MSRTPEGNGQGRHSRRAVLRTAAGGALALAFPFLFRSDARVNQAPQNNWPTDTEGILRRIDAEHFLPGSYLSTTFLPRKIMWEEAQLAKRNKTWEDGDESDWIAHQD